MTFRSGTTRLDPRAWTGADRLFALVVAAVLVAPVVALVQATSSGWAPYGDDATVALRAAAILDGHWQITGMRSTTGVGDAKLSAHHPGPVEFYLLAPFLALTGGSATGVALGCTMLSFVAAAWSLVWARRIGSRLGLLVFGGSIVLAQWALGPELLYRPLNPYFGTGVISLALLTATALLTGHRGALPGFVVATAVAAQANLAFVPLVLALVCLVVLARLVSVARSGDRRRGLRSRPARCTVVAMVVGVLLWLPTLCELVLRDPDNLEILRWWVIARPQTSPSTSSGIAHLALLAPVPGGFRAYSNELLARDGTGAAVVGGFVLVALVALVATGSRAHGRTSTVVPAVVALVANLGMVGTAFVMPSAPAAAYWLVHWIPVATFTWAALVWGVAGRVRRLSPRLPGAPTLRLGAAAVVLALLLQTLLVRPPLEDGSPYRRVTAAVVDALGPGKGRSAQVNGGGFLPLLAAAPAVSFGLHQRGWEPHYLAPWPYPEDAEELSVDADDEPDASLLILDTMQPEFASDLPDDAEKIAVVEAEPGRYLVVYRMPQG